MLNIRELFSKYRVTWRDRGKNVSHGNIVISCPYCNKTYNKDHGEHLAISNIGEYFCYRNPSHKGRNLAILFRMLNIPSHEYKDLKFEEAPRTQKREKDFSVMDYFQPAEESQEALEYLTSRLFERPLQACKQFKLLTAKEGRYAGRLIIPLTVGFTGRAMRSHLELRYDAYTTEDGFFLHKQGSTSAMLLEGAIDAMRVATVTTQFDVIGKCGNRLSPALLAYLRSSKYLSIWDVPDGDVDFSTSVEEYRMLKSYCGTFADVKRFEMPTGKKDFGLMTESASRKWLINAC